MHSERLAAVVSVGLIVMGALSLSCTVDSDIRLAEPTLLPIVKAAPLDILFVVDNSPSMQDEQATLARSVWDPRCPLSDTRQVPMDLQDPSRETFEALTQVCGLSQLLAMMRGDFHIGVITTDVALCDERFPSPDLDPLHEPQPMRGCLQGPGLITPDSDVEADFKAAMLGVGIYGSPIERGLDAMEVFLTPGGRRGEGCDDDLDGFLRPDGRLLIVFVADEDDCSHRDGENGFPNELEHEPETCSPIDSSSFVNYDARNCQNRSDELASVESYRATLQKLVQSGRTSDVYVAIVGGLVQDNGRLEPSGCAATDDGDVRGDCLQTFGSHNTCAPDENCCSADAAHRYVQLARAVNEHSLMGSICAPDFSTALLPLFFQAELGGDDVFH
jgi:hypothetical protein